MGGERTPGIESRSGRLRIYYRWNRKLHRHTLDLDDTPRNRRAAAKMLETIKAKIRAGVYDPAEFFDGPSSGLTVQAYAERWIGLQTHLADSTVAGYQSTITAMLVPAIGQMRIRDVTPSVLAAAFENHGWRSAKARNNALSPVRGVFELARRDGETESNPADMLRSAKVQKPDPDPLTLEEVEALLGWMREHRDAQIANYFEFAIFTGLRTSEMLGLQWGDVDMRRGVVRVQRAWVQGKASNRTKTAKARDVDLSERAKAALKRQKAHTFLHGAEIFHDPITGRRYVDDKPPRLQWNAALKGLGLRARVAYQTRHTFATLALMYGANPMWVSRQLGHATMQMTLTRYSRWIDQADQGREVAKFDAALGGPHGNTHGNTCGNK